MNVVFLNAEKLDFNQNLDFSSISDIASYSWFDETPTDKILERVEGMDVVITKEMAVPAEIVEQFPASVKLLCEAGTGFNNIAIDVARKKGISVCNVPTYSTEAVAQMAITFMMNFSASMQTQRDMLNRGDFSNFTEYLKVPHFELPGKVFGSIGGGAIGMTAVKIALALGMKVLVSDPFATRVDHPDISYVALDELLKQADFVSIHCPLNDATKYLLNKDNLTLMKPGAFLINTSRGPIINEADLIEILKQGKIAGAGLDVQEVEPPSPENPLFSMPNVMMTPHIGWRRYESRQRLVQLTADNIVAFSKDEPINVVN